MTRLFGPRWLNSKKRKKQQEACPSTKIGYPWNYCARLFPFIALSKEELGRSIVFALPASVSFGLADQLSLFFLFSISSHTLALGEKKKEEGKEKNERAVGCQTGVLCSHRSTLGSLASRTKAEK